MMRTQLFLLSMLFFPWALFSATAAPAASETKAQRGQNVPPDMVDPIDTTDVFAVPVSPSDQEEELMGKKLEQMQKKPPKPHGKN